MSTLPKREAGITRANKKTLVDNLHRHWSGRVNKMLRERNNLSQEEKEYLVDKMSTMKDEKLKNILTGLIGWGDDERAELETFVAASLELFKQAPPSAIREAFRLVELRWLSGQLTAAPVPKDLDNEQV